MPGGSGHSAHFQINKGSKDPHLIALSENLHLTDEDIGLHKCESNGDSRQQSMSNSEKKRTRNIGSKSKRLLMHSEDVLELRLTWEEAQDLLRPPPNVKPSIVTIEDHEFEEYDVCKSWCLCHSKSYMSYAFTDPVFVVPISVFWLMF